MLFNRRAVLTGLLATGVAAGGLVPGVATASGQTATQTVTVKMTRTSMQVIGAAGLHAGRIHFHVVSADGKSHLLQIIRLHQGYTLPQLFQDVGTAFSAKPPANVPAVQSLDMHTTLHGGAPATATRDGDVIEGLPANRYLLFDVDSQHSQPKFITVTGTPPGGAAHLAQGNITAFSFGFGNISASLPAHGWIRLYNRADQPHMFVMQRVAPDTTPAQVRAYLNSGAQTPPPFGRPGSMDSAVVSPQLGMLVRFDLNPGKFLVQCFWPGFRSGMPHVMMGMWKLVVLH